MPIHIIAYDSPYEEKVGLPVEDWKSMLILSSTGLLGWTDENTIFHCTTGISYAD